MVKRSLEEGASAKASTTVTEADVASRVLEDPGVALPPVYATARMIALMEIAAARVLSEILGDGEQSVGVEVVVEHTAATPIGAPVTAEAKFIGMEGKLYAFEVRAFDPGGEIGSGEHLRAVIDVARLVRGAEKRIKMQ